MLSHSINSAWWSVTVVKPCTDNVQSRLCVCRRRRGLHGSKVRSTAIMWVQMKICFLSIYSLQWNPLSVCFRYLQCILYGLCWNSNVVIDTMIDAMRSTGSVGTSVDWYWLIWMEVIGTGFFNGQLTTSSLAMWGKVAVCSAYNNGQVKCWNQENLMNSYCLHALLNVIQKTIWTWPLFNCRLDISESKNQYNESLDRYCVTHVK